MGHNYVGTEHIFFGLIRARPGIAPAAMRKFGADLEKARRAVTEILQPPPVSVQEPPKR